MEGAGHEGSEDGQPRRRSPASSPARSRSAAGSTPTPPSRSSASRSSSASTRDYLSGVHVLVGLGVVMVDRRAAQLQVAERRRHHRLRRRDDRPHLHLQPRPVPLDAVPVLLVGPRGCSPGSAASSPATRPTRTCRRAARSSPTRGTPRATRSEARSSASADETPGPPRGGPGVSSLQDRSASRTARLPRPAWTGSRRARRCRRQASSRIVTGPSFTSSTCMCAPNTPVSTGTPSARSAST